MSDQNPFGLAMITAEELQLDWETLIDRSPSKDPQVIGIALDWVRAHLGKRYKGLLLQTAMSRVLSASKKDRFFRFWSYFRDFPEGVTNENVDDFFRVVRSILGQLNSTLKPP